MIIHLILAVRTAPVDDLFTSDRAFTTRSPLPTPPTLNYSGSLSEIASAEERNETWSTIEHGKIFRQIATGVVIALNLIRKKEPARSASKRVRDLHAIRISKDWLRGSVTGDFSLFAFPEEVVEEYYDRLSSCRLATRRRDARFPRLSRPKCISRSFGGLTRSCI
jgi:hypothetical protein